MQHDAPRRGLHPGAELQELFAQGAYLSPTEGGAYRFEAQFLIEDVRSGGEQRSQLIGEEAGATGAVGLAPVVQLFDPISYVAASAVDRFLQVLGRSFEVRNHEGRIVFGVATGMATTSALMITHRRWGQVRAPRSRHRAAPEAVHAARSCGSRREGIPTAPTDAVTLPGHST